MAAQARLLMDLLQDDKDTEYGKKCGFADIAFFYRGIFASKGVFSVPVALDDHSSSLVPDCLFSARDLRAV